MRGDHSTDGTCIGCSVGRPANILEHGANIETGATLDASQGLPLVGLSQQVRSPVINQQYNELRWPLILIRLTCTYNGIISCDLLTCTVGGQQRQEYIEVVQCRQHFLYSRKHEV